MTFAAAVDESAEDNNGPQAESPSAISVEPLKRLRVSSDEINETISDVRLEIVCVSSVNADAEKLDPGARMSNCVVRLTKAFICEMYSRPLIEEDSSTA